MSIDWAHPVVDSPIPLRFFEFFRVVVARGIPWVSVSAEFCFEIESCYWGLFCGSGSFLWCDVVPNYRLVVLLKLII